MNNNIPLFKPIASLCIYWQAYGGWKGLFSSLYLWMSIVIAILALLYNLCEKEPWPWVDAVKDIIPSILGFSLGGYAMLMGFGDEKFRNLMIDTDDFENISMYMSINASFMHFIFVQFLCIFISSIASILHMQNNPLFFFFGTALFVYSLFTIISTSFSILNMADCFNALRREENKQATNEPLNTSNDNQK